MTIRKNATIIVLATMIVLALSASFSATEMINGYNLQFVTVHSKTFEEIEHFTMNTYLRTSSETEEHRTFVAAGCMECSEELVGWSESYGNNFGIGPNSTRVIKRYPESCWVQHSTTKHGAAHFDVVFQ